MRARDALGLLAGAGQAEGVGVVAEGQQQGHREGRARGQARTDRQRAGDPGDPAARRGLERRSPAARGASSATGAAPAQDNLEGLPGNWSESIPTRKLPGLGVKVTSVASSMAMGGRAPRCSRCGRR